MYKLRFWFGVLYTYLIIRSGLYYTYSRFFRALFQRKYKAYPLNPYYCLSELLSDAEHWKWKRDSWKEGFDVINYSGLTQYRINQSIMAFGDCDDWSMYLCHAFHRLEQVHTLFLNKTCQNFRLLSVVFLGKKLKGHNVCVFEIIVDGQKTFAYASNWNNAVVCTQDPWGEPFKSINDVVRNVCGTHKNVGWAIADLSCKSTKEHGRLK